MKCKLLRLSLLSCALMAQIMAAPFTPQMILQDGEDQSISINPYTQESGEARKGTVAATLNNIALLNQIILKEPSPGREEEIKATIQAIDQLIPSLKVIGMFDLFEPRYWVGQGEQIGRIVVLSLYFKQYPEKDTEQLKLKIRSLTTQISSPTLRELFESL